MATKGSNAPNPMARALEVRRVRVSKVNPAAYNPRKDLQPGDPEYEALRRSMEEFGFVEPLVWNKRTGNLVGGHQRLKVLLAAGATGVDVSVVDLPLHREKALNVALNKVGGDWDLPKLGELLKELQAMPGIDETVTGFSQREIDALFRELEPPTPEPDENIDRATTAAKGLKVVRGQVWELGRHRLMCGDATSREDMDRLMAGARAAMLFADPPYNVDYGAANQSHPSWGKRWAKGAVTGDAQLRAEWESFLRAWLRESLRVLRGACYICMSAKEWPSLRIAFAETGGHWSSDIIWVKDRAVLGRKDYHSRFEALLYGWPEGVKRAWLGGREQNDVWEIQRHAVNDLHPTQKPVELVHRALQDACPPRGIVLDPFVGSGTTLVAAEGTACACYAMEIEPRYCAVAIARWELYTGAKAMLHGSSDTRRPRAAARR